MKLEEDIKSSLETLEGERRGSALGGGAERVSDLEAEIAALRVQLSAREGRLEAILEVGRALGSTLSLDQVLGLIMDRITYLMDADRSTLFLLDEERSELWSKVVQGRRVSEIRLKVGEGIAGWVARTGKSINIKDAYRDPRFNRNIDIATGYQTRSCLCQPIRNQERRIIGVVQVLNKGTGHFTVEDENLLSAIASQTAISIENSKLYLSVVAKNIELLEYKERLEQKMYELDILYEIAREASQAQDLENLLTSIGYRSLDVVDADACAITLSEPRRGTTVYCMRRARDDDGQRRVRALGLEKARGISARVLERGEACVLPSSVEPAGREALAALAADEPACELLELPLRSVVGVPLSIDEQVMGCLQLFNKLSYNQQGRPQPFEQEDVKLLTLIASQISGAIATQLRRERREKANRLAAIGQMLSSVLHDLKTPVSIISGYVQLMVRQDQRETREQYAASILKQFDTLSRMTREVLAFARGDSTILLRKVYVHKLMDEATQMLRNEIGERAIALDVVVDYRGVARLDEVKIKRVLANLARNAVEAMPDGGAIRVHAFREGDAFALDFSDDGPGIPEAIRGRLFESFVSQGKLHGTGLGLAIVRKIVDEHQGTIDYESETGRGTTFHIRLPIGEGEA